jgi:hypothetical protein
LIIFGCLLPLRRLHPHLCPYSRSKHTINTVQTLDFLRDLVSTIPDPILSEAKPTSRPRRPTDAEPSAPRKKRTRKVKQESSGAAEGDGEGEAEGETAEPLPDIGTWKRDMSGGGGTGEGGKGLYDDYEVEDDDY